MEEDIALRPMDIGFLGGIGIVFEADGFAQLVWQFLGFGGGLIGHGRWLFCYNSSGMSMLIPAGSNVHWDRMVQYIIRISYNTASFPYN